VQVSVLPVSGADHGGAARELVARLVAGGVRAEVAARGSLSARIRRCCERRMAYGAVLGNREVAEGRAAVSEPGGGRRADLPVEALLDRLRSEIGERRRERAVV
jgi:threonyl-tRNA synthetase